MVCWTSYKNPFFIPGCIIQFITSQRQHVFVIKGKNSSICDVLFIYNFCNWGAKSHIAADFSLTSPWAISLFEWRWWMQEWQQLKTSLPIRSRRMSHAYHWRYICIRKWSTATTHTYYYWHILEKECSRDGHTKESHSSSYPGVYSKIFIWCAVVLLFHRKDTIGR